MDVSPNDFIEVKSVVSVLGYLTKSSVASLNGKKKLAGLENEYMKLRSNIKKFELSCIRFPCLADIDSFSTGLLTVLMHIVSHLNLHKKKFEDDKVIMQKILMHGQKVAI